MNERFSNVGSQADPAINTREGIEGRESIATMIRGLAADLGTLFSKELSLAKAELREAAGELKAALGTIAMGAVLAMAGVVVLLLAAVAGLNNVLDLWLSALIVGLAALVVGFAMVKGASKKVEPKAFIPERAIESVHKDKTSAARVMR